MCYVNCWKILKWCCPLIWKAMFPWSASVEQCFTAFPQFVLPKITLGTRVTVKAKVSFALEPQWWANTHIKAATEHRALMPLAHLAFFRGGLQLPCLSHLRQEGHKVHLPPPTQDVTSFITSTLAAHQWRGPVRWVFCGQHVKQVAQYLYKVECRGDSLLPLLRRTDRCAVCTKERQGRAAICCWKIPGSSFSPGTAKSCRWLLRASSSHHSGLTHRAIFHRGSRNPNPPCVNQEEEDGFTDFSNHPCQQQSKEGRRYGKPTVPPGGTWVEKSNVSHR